MSLPQVTLVYLALPLGLFLPGWLRGPLGIPLTIVLAAAVYDACRQSAAPDVASAGGTRAWPWALAAALVLAMLCGAGPFGAQVHDWEKHNAVLKDLIVSTWPVTYGNAPPPPEPGRAALVYYLGYYLPAAAVGKALGWAAGYVFLFGWSVLGIFLVLLWFGRLAGSPPVAATAIFIFAGGLDVIGSLVVRRSVVPDLGLLEWWAGFEYSSNYHSLQWAPQHALGGWLATALVIDGARRGTLPPVAGLLVATTAFWSPFASLGLLPFVAYGCARRLKSLLCGWSNWIACLPIILVLGCFYASLAERPSHGFVTWQFLMLLWRRILLFEILKVGVFAVLCALILRSERASFQLLAVASASLFVIPMYHAGIYNDFVMRTSIPALFVLGILEARALTGAYPLRYRAVLWLAVVIGALSPAVSLVRAVSDFRVGIPAPASIVDVPVVQKARHPAIARQYVGDRDAFFFRVLAR